MAGLGHALLIDISPGDVRVALMAARGGGRPTFSQNAKFKSGDFASLEAMLAHYCALAGLTALPTALGLSLAQPVTQDVIALPAPAWIIDKNRLKDDFGFAEVIFVNDTSATASSLLWLGRHDVKPIGHTSSEFQASPSSGRYGVMSINAGLGIASLVGQTQGFAVVDSEGGHSGFAPQTADQVLILNELMKKYPRVTNEMLLTMDGITRVYSAICAASGEADMNLSALEVILYGKTSAEENCRKALSAYFDILASVAGDVALNLCAVDGFFISGDLVNAVAGILPQERFREVFQEKGSFTEFVGRIPTYVITNSNARLIGLARVISERAESEEKRSQELSRPEALISEITSAIDQAIMILCKDLKIVACTRQSWYNLPGAPGLTEPGQPFERYVRALAQAGQFGLAGSDRTADEIITRLAGGLKFDFSRTTFGGRSLRARAEPRKSGGYVIVETDTTELDTRTKELEELTANLREAKMKSDAASRAKSEFLANMSHEIRTPLNGVLGMADVLRRTPLDKSQSDMLDVVIKSGNGLLTVINDILDFSKLEAGKVRLLEKPFNLRGAIEDVASMFSTQAEKKNLELVVRVSPDAPEWVVGDVGRLRQILTNIAGNAVKFTQKGHILIDVQCLRVRGGRASLVFAVQDTGDGIPEDRLGAIFEMFEQVDGSSTRTHEGTGLGLTITKRIVEAMKGEIDVQSVVGEGSVFSIRIDLSVHEGEASEDPRPDCDASVFEGARVLIVDDHEVNRQILCEQTQSWGMSALSARDGHEALETLEKEAREGRAVDIAILDYQMPTMDGQALARAIKRHKAFANLPLILLTSVGHVGDREDFAASDFSAYLVKPARSAQLRESISAALLRARRGDRPSQAIFQAGEDSGTSGDRSEGDAAARAPEEAQSEDAAPVRTLKVFIVEDNLVNRMVISSMLKNPGYELIEIGDGAKAVEEFKAGAPDLILMDVSMPVLDGYAATRIIRRLEKESGAEKGVPIIGVTAHALPEDRARCVESGMNDYLSKPISQTSLEQKIKLYCA